MADFTVYVRRDGASVEEREHDTIEQALADVLSRRGVPGIEYVKLYEVDGIEENFYPETAFDGWATRVKEIARQYQVEALKDRKQTLDWIAEVVALLSRADGILSGLYSVSEAKRARPRVQMAIAELATYGDSEAARRSFGLDNAVYQASRAEVHKAAVDGLVMEVVTS